MSYARFNEVAASWDEQPARVALAAAIARTILEQVPVNPGMAALDFGCGTGLVTLALQPHVRTITGLDASPGMLAGLQEKTAAAGIANVETLQLDLTTTPPPPSLRIDLIVSAMALHHIADIPALLRVLAGLLEPGGYLALADLDVEDSTFHTDMTGVHHAGIDRDWLQAQLTTLGFTDLRAATAHVVERPENHRYPVFLVSGRR